MTAEIIKFTPRLLGPLTPSGFHFPAVYRLTGFSYKDVTLKVPDYDYPWTQYRLSDDPVTHITETKFTHITHLDPAHDDGWVIVRWHPNRSEATTYLNGFEDGLDDVEYDRAVRSLWQTPAGIFTLVHRKARRGCENRLLTYYYWNAGYGGTNVPWPGDYWFHIVRGDGTLVCDNTYNDHCPSSGDILWPPDDDDE